MRVRVRPADPEREDVPPVVSPPLVEEAPLEGGSFDGVLAREDAVPLSGNAAVLAVFLVAVVAAGGLVAAALTF